MPPAHPISETDSVHRTLHKVGLPALQASAKSLDKSFTASSRTGYKAVRQPLKAAAKENSKVHRVAAPLCPTSLVRSSSDPGLRRKEVSPSSVQRSRQPGDWRAGNVVKARRNFTAGDTQIRCGQRGRIRDATASHIEVIFGESSATWMPRNDANGLEIQVVTHEVELINQCGQPVGQFLLCILLDQHDDYMDILCQDGREGRSIHAGFVRKLPSTHLTDVGYLATASPSASALNVCRAEGESSVSDQVGLRIAQLASKRRLGAEGVDATSEHYELPPSGFRRACPKTSGFFAAGSALRATRARSVKAQVQPEGPDRQLDLLAAVPGHVAEQRNGSNICPFMEIQEGGLRAMVGECNLTTRDVVFDLGCGQGKILNRLLESFPCRGVGIEVNPQLARVAEQRLQRFGSRAHVIVDDVRNIDMSEATALVAFFLSHSYEAAGSALKEHLGKTLQPGCVVYNYCYPIIGWRGTYNNGVHKYVIGEHLDPDAG